MSTKRDRPLPPLPTDDGYEVPVNSGYPMDTEDNQYESIPYHENSRKILVKKLPRDVSIDTIELYFENKRCMGRSMSVTDVDLDQDNEEAVVTFASSGDVQYVLERHKTIPCELQRQTLVVEPLDIPDKETVDFGASKRSSQNYSDMYESTPCDEETDTIEVRNFSKDCSKDLLHYYFENTRRSGGGDIISHHLNRDKGFSHIQFADKSVVKRVIEKWKHIVEGSELSVAPFIISKTDLLLDEVPDTVNEENVLLFVEAKLKNSVSSVVFNQDKTKALVQMQEPYDFKKATEMCTKHKLGGVNVVPVQVPVTSGIVVTNLPEDVTHDSVELYFENTQRSQGGPTRNVELHLDDGYCLVFFKDVKVVGRVCKKNDHKIHSQHVDVKPYNEFFGLPAEIDDLAPQLPEPITLNKENPYKMKFLKVSRSRRVQLEQKLGQCNAHIFFDDDHVTIECTLTKRDRPSRKSLSNWPQKAMDCVKEFTDDLQVTEKTVDTKLWEPILRELNNLHFSNPDDVALIAEKERGRVIFVAHKGVASDWKKIENEIDSVEKKEKEKNETATEEKVLERWKITYLKASNFEVAMKHAYNNVQIKYDEKKIIITGPKGVITSVLLKMFESIQNVKNRDMELEEEQIQLLQNDATREKVKKQMKRTHVSDVWEVKRDKVVLYANDDDDLDKMETVINNTLAKFTINLDSGKGTILKSDKWQATEKSLRDKFSGCFKISIHDTHLVIFTLSDIQDKVSHELQTFLSKNAIYKEQMSQPPHIISFFKHVIKTSFEKDLQFLKDKGLNVKIDLNEKSGAVLIEGTSEGINEGKKMIKRLQDKIEAKKLKIDKPKIKKYFDCRHGKDCVKNVQSNTPCVIDMQGSAFKRSLHLQKGSNIVKFDKPTICAEAFLGSRAGIKVHVVGGDMTELQVDVIVNAANSEMKHAGGLAAVILNKGGRGIQAECDDYIRKKGSLREGKVFMSKGGHLKCKFVAHAVGPHWRGGDNDEEQCLQQAVFACLEKTEKRQLTSIALPALSAGMFQYPVNLSCKAIIKAIDQHIKGSKSCIKEVYLCDINKATVCAFTEALKVVAPDLNVLVDLKPDDGQSQQWLINSDDKKTGAQSKESSTNINIEVVKGELVKEQVDVIVNSTSPDLQLQRGLLSKAILKAGGRKIQEECDRNYSDGINVGDVAVTTAGHLQCSKVYHIAIKHFDNKSPRLCLQGLNECVTACLQEADKQGFTSISFPAMGTGAQKYPKDKVAREMFKAATDYGSKFPSSSVNHVRFVIYTQDDDTYESFVTEEKNWKSDDHHRPPSSLGKPTKSAVGKLVNESRGRAEFLIGNIKLFIRDGDITEDDSEAIVASCNMDLDLSKGAVTKAILKKGGDAIPQDCKQQKSTMKKDGVAITTAGNLKAKYIIHVDTKYKTRDWPPVVKACLKKAEKRNFSSIAFPALGTSVGCKPEDIAEVICMAINDFQKDNPVHLQKIKLIIFQNDMLTDFITAMKRSVVGGRPHSAQGNSQDHQTDHSRRSRYRHHKSDQQEGTNDTSEDSCTFTVYAESKEKVDSAIRTMERTVKKEWITKSIEDQGIHRLTNKHIMEVKTMAGNNHVDVNIDTDIGNITVTGLVANVVDVLDAIHKQLRSADSSFYMKGQAKLMSSMVKWIFIKDQKERPFYDRVNLEIETAYRNKEKTVKVKDFSGGEYVIDFGTMQEHDVKKPNEFFPVIRRDLVAGASFDIPKHWSSMNDKDNLKLVTLNQNDSEYQNVLKEFLSSLGRQPSIVKIERIQNKTLYTQYSAKRKEMNNNNNKSKNERVLWHGTADYAVQSINSHGFNRSYCGKNATAIGQGVYFAVNSQYSDQATYSPQGSDGNKRMYRCLVLTGKYCAGSSDMRVPPPIDKSKPHILYDSVTNNPSNPAMFVVFNDTQAYPEHIITYK